MNHLSLFRARLEEKGYETYSLGWRINYGKLTDAQMSHIRTLFILGFENSLRAEMTSR